MKTDNVTGFSLGSCKTSSDMMQPKKPKKNTFLTSGFWPFFFLKGEHMTND